jgi:hypothetical protein
MMDIWVTSSGKKIPVTCMKDSHLENAIKMVQRIITKPGERAHYLDKLRMLTAEKNRRVGKMSYKHAVASGWHVRTASGKAHWVNVYDGVPAPMARCGHKPMKDGKWYEAHAGDNKCIKCCLLTGDAGARVKKTQPEETRIEVEANYLQVVGPEIPLCWIPVDDVKAVVMLLAMHKPSSESLRIVQAQFDTAIGNLNKYIEEAQERNIQGGVGVVTWTHSGEKKKDK